MIQFDLCLVVHCVANEREHLWSEKYICEVPEGTGFTYDRRCGPWSRVIIQDLKTGKIGIASIGPNLV